VSVISSWINTRLGIPSLFVKSETSPHNPRDKNRLLGKSYQLDQNESAQVGTDQEMMVLKETTMLQESENEDWGERIVWCWAFGGGDKALG
jgi:hypothetical protein